MKKAIAGIVLALSVVGPARGSPSAVSKWHVYSSEAAASFGIPVEWIERVMAAESAGRVSIDGRPIRSSRGAMGLMQLMPATWADMRARLGLGNDPDEPRDNIMAGTFYLRLLFDRFGYPGLFAAYNAGPKRYAAYLARMRGLPSETLAYLKSVTGKGRQKEVAAVPSPVLRPTLFAVRRDGGEQVNTASLASIFAVRTEGE